jgi:uncharacterized protein YcnI
LADKAETFTADGQSNITLLSAVSMNTAGTALTVDLREGSAGGTIKYTFQVPINSSLHVPFPEGVLSATGAWYVDVTGGATPRVTVTGD